MNEEIFVKVCCDMVIEKDGRILMGKRGNIFGRGSWGFPSGHLEVNEKTFECVARELDEEVGIKPLDMKLLGIVNDIADVSNQTDHFIRFIYHIIGYSGEITNKEPDKCEGWEWFDKNKLPEPTFVGHIKILKFFLNKQNEFFLE